MFKYLLLLVILVLSTHSQVSVEWTQTHNDTIVAGNYSGDEGYLMCKDNSGKIFISGTCFARINNTIYGRIVTIAYDGNGNVLWKKNYVESYLQSTGSIYVHSMNSDNNGNIIISGRNYSRLLLLKYSNSGNLIWAKDSSETINNTNITYVSTIDQQGNIYCTYRHVIGSSYDIMVKKYNTEGNLQWTKSYNGSGNTEDHPYSITTDANGNVLIGGYENAGGQGVWGYCCVLKYDSNGNLLWNKSYPNVKGEITESLTSSNGDVYTAGTLLNTFPNHEIIVIKYNSNGDQSWVSRYSGRPEYLWNETFDMSLDNSDNVYITGFTEKGYPYSDYVTIKYNSAGILQWNSFYNSSNNHVDIATNVKADNNGNVYITGTAMLQSGESYTTLKYNNNGVQQWAQVIDAQLQHPAYIYPVLINDADNLYIFGSKKLTSPHSHTDYILTKYHEVIGITNISNNIPNKYNIEQNYPNPFNPITNIKFDIVKSGLVKINIYDAVGRNIQQLVNQNMAPGSYKVDWDASAYPSGVYFYKLETVGFTQTRKMVLVK